MSTLDYIVQVGGKQHLVQKGRSFLVDKIPNCQDDTEVDVVCLMQDNKLCNTTIKANVKKSFLLNKNKTRLSKRKGRSHHSKGIRGGRSQHTMLVIGDKN